MPYKVVVLALVLVVGTGTNDHGQGQRHEQYSGASQKRRSTSDHDYRQDSSAPSFQITRQIQINIKARDFQRAWELSEEARKSGIQLNGYFFNAGDTSTYYPTSVDENFKFHVSSIPWYNLSSLLRYHKL